MTLLLFLIPYTLVVLFLAGYIFFGLRMVRQQGTFTTFASVISWVFFFLFFIIIAGTLFFVLNYDLSQIFISF